MPVPNFQSFFKPLLQFTADGEEHSMKEINEKLAAKMKLTKEDILELVPSGVQSKYENRISWAASYFVQAKVLDRPRRSYIQITERGLDLLKQNHDRIDVGILNQYPEFIDFHKGSRAAKEPPIVNTDITPEESLQHAYLNIRNQLASDILTKIKDNSPKFFENLVVDLMVAMGYGGSRADAGKSVGQSGDEGIDGIINEDRLGLDVIYLQAKKWDGTVGRPEIQKFVGALHGKRAKKGVFITTGKFSEEAVEYVRSIDPKVILIDGLTLANYMIDFKLGTSTTAVYEIKRIDSDYFIED